MKTTDTYKLIRRIGGLRGLLLGLFEGALMFCGLYAWMAVLFWIAPLPGR